MRVCHSQYVATWHTERKCHVLFFCRRTRNYQSAFSLLTIYLDIINRIIYSILQHQAIMLSNEFVKQRTRRRFITQPRSRFVSLQNSRNDNYDNSQHSQARKNSLNQFHNELNRFMEQQKRQLLKLNRSRKHNERTLRNQMQKSLQLSQIKCDLETIKGQIDTYKKKSQINQAINLTLKKKMENSIDQKLNRIKKSVNLPMISTPYASNQFIPPVPYFPPFLYPPYPISPPSKQKPQQKSEESEQQKPQPKKLKRNDKKPKKKLSKAEIQRNRARLRKILRKVFLAVTYIFFLKKVTKGIMAKRRQIFNKFWPANFQKSTTGMRKWFSSGCRQFFEQMHKKSQVQLPIEGDQNFVVMAQKKKAIQILLKIFIQCLENLVDNPAFEQIIRIVHIFCKHGAFIDNGVLTPEQLETVCISEVYGYLRMDKAAEKSQIVNFLFMKLILFNLLLQPWKYNEKAFNINQKKQAYQNFYYISSVFYQIISYVQDRLLDENHGDYIQIGNWRKLKSKYRIKCSPSLCHLESNHEGDQMISGLVSQNIINSVFPLEYWSQQINTIQSLVERMHNKLRKAHAKLVNQVCEYKNIAKFQ